MLESKEERALTKAQLAELVYEAQTQTAQIARLASQIINGVLLCETITIPTGGSVSRDFGVPFGSVLISRGPTGAGVLTLAAGGAVGSSAPVAGPGVAVLPVALAAGTFALTGHELTVWGSAGDVITVQVFTGVVPPAFAVA